MYNLNLTGPIGVVIGNEGEGVSLSLIHISVWTRKGNYMVFFPSYKFMEDVLEVYENEFSAEWVRCI